MFMTKKIINSVKYFALFGLILLSVIACERDFENIGVGLVDNNQFSTKDSIFEVIAYNKNVDSSRVDAIPQYLLGVYRDENFGFIKTSFVSQLGLPGLVDFGDEVSIDTIILNIPYYATRQEDLSDGKPSFKLDSIIGDQDLEYKLSVYESGTFLNVLDPQDPTKGKKYYSNEDYNRKTLLYSGLFNPNKNDTVLYVKRRFLGENLLEVNEIDTIKADLLTPSVKIPLDTAFFRDRFVNQQSSGVFGSNESFIDYFRGILLETELADGGTNGSLMTLAMSDASIIIYYTNTITANEADSNTDLNGDGDTVDEDVPVRTKQLMSFPFGGLRASEYRRDYTTSNVQDRVVTPDSINGEKKIYIQGAAGTMAVLEMFRGIDLNAIRNENWLINEANLTLYLDQEVANNTNVPEQLFLYRYKENSQILDAFTEAQVNGIGGFLERDEDNKPINYKFRVTDYISQVLKKEEPFGIEKFGLKVFHSTDAPNFLVTTDTIVKDYSWIAKGVVLRGNDLLEIDENYDERLKLEIFYTIKND